MYTKLKISAIFLSILLMFNISTSVFADGDNNTIVVSVEVPTVSAKSVVILDANSGQIVFENAPDEQLPVSYLVKLMTLLLTAEAIEKGKINFESKVTTSTSANKMGDPQIWLNVGEQITVDELVKSITIGNANDACVALAEAIGGSESDFVSMMNNKAQQLGMNNTVFINCTGIEIAGQYSSARDIAILSKELLKYEKFIPYMTTWMTDVRNGQTNLVNTNTMVRTYKGITGLKAATSQEAGNCLAISANRNNLHLICVMLGCNDAKQRFVDAKVLLDYTFSVNQYFNPQLTKDELKDIRVKGGEQKKVSIRCEDKTGIVISRGTSKNVKTNIVLTEEIEAPVKKGQVVGEVQFYDGEKLLFKTNIITEKPVRKISIKYCFNKLLDYMLKM